MNLDLDLDLVKSRTQTATHGHGEHTTHGRGHAKEGVGPNRGPGIQESANLPLAACRSARWPMRVSQGEGLACGKYSTNEGTES